MNIVLTMKWQDKCVFGLDFNLCTSNHLIFTVLYADGSYERSLVGVAVCGSTESNQPCSSLL